MEHYAEREDPGHRPGHPVSQDQETQPEEGIGTTLRLFSLGETDDELLARLRLDLTNAGFPVVGRGTTLSINEVYDEQRGQYNSTKLLAALRNSPSERAGPGEKVLGVIRHDLFVPVLTFVFGEAELSGDHAIVSYHRLESERYGLQPDRRLLAERLLKESIHEVGHLFGLKHCHSPSCVMRSSTSVEEIDTKSAGFCMACSPALPFARPRRIPSVL
jgi:archaemetzincin